MKRVILSLIIVFALAACQPPKNIRKGSWYWCFYQPQPTPACDVYFGDDDDSDSR